MKNKGMHQQPNAFTPSTGHGAPQSKNMNKGGLTPTSQQHGQPAPQSWNKPQAAPSQAPAGNKSFVKPGKKAA